MERVKNRMESEPDSRVNKFESNTIIFDICQVHRGIKYETSQ